MADQKPALVLHLATGGEPLLFALTTEETERLTKDLSHFVRTGSVQTIQTRDDSEVAINFSHVAAAYIDDLNRKTRVFGLH
ncbi:hypothetical protein ED92_05055 [Amycolatopsis sp. MJM2582]|uniref:DUF3107 domain-containing protein n=3 Tax=Amycolatopsis japonica group TaxID=2893673 RepID=R4SWD0_9PSEU|nr:MULTISPECIES: hypothetical protein [Amycolatopsis]AGM02828.1 hypothetical protein AORI_0239 [Amycolatopsis keratiniphila]AIG73185.1 Hypothetical protein AJAP_01240 [Amycolatopsis japonica]KFZ83273.1 hypothetical protein ED92_05055 [Amycolatopsis sp. MJM2582]OKJ98701.1 hypothetical protein AMK34_17835 [Amycolatopsis sp. CB00013]OLZ59671.1 hypothetical protein BS330_04670 [Amycolatopsis keratiniphila subsp. nogabecina]